MIEGLHYGPRVEIFCAGRSDAEDARHPAVEVAAFDYVTDADGQSTWFAAADHEETAWFETGRHGMGIERVRHQFRCPTYPQCTLSPEARASKIDELFAPYVGTYGASRVPLVVLDRMLST